jgi:hypothetical protein
MVYLGIATHYFDKIKLKVRSKEVRNAGMIELSDIDA